MIVFYFSGTGNSRWVAEQFASALGSKCCSIEEGVNVPALVAEEEIIGFCYPVYGSCVPRPMREFVVANREALSGKRFVILSTQLFFSGNGAQALCAFLPGGEKNVIYAEHIKMPNNIANFPLFPVKNGTQNAKCIQNAKEKVERAGRELACGIIRRRGFHGLSIIMGKTQSAFWPRLEQKASKDVRVSDACIRCGLCARICPMHNLSLGENGIEQAGRCAVCYRCVNTCPEQAITTLIHQRPRKQYRGISSDSVHLSR
jgi:ferredoxin